MSESFADFLRDIGGKKVAVIGIGISNAPVIELLLESGAKVIAYDKKSEDELGDIARGLRAAGVALVCGRDYLERLEGDVIFRTPGLRYDHPALELARARGALVTSEMELFFEFCPCKIIAVTGSDGKTTTTSLIYEFLRHAGKTAHLGGNIGKPLLPQIENISENDVVVAELSSFQLHTMTKSPDVAVVTNVSPNHLDYHIDMAEYIDAKRNIFRHQSKNGVLIVNACNSVTNGFAASARGRVLKFAFGKKPEGDGAYYLDGAVYVRIGGVEQKLMDRSDILLRGDHNVENMMAALLAVWGIASKDDILSVARGFAGVRHRIELVRQKDGICFYNDSIGSSPTRTIATMRSFDKKVILIAGGHDKHIPFTELVKELPLRAKAVFLTGDTAKAIGDEIFAAKWYDPDTLHVEIIDDFENAVKAAAAYAKRGDIVLLSPACASFDKFKNFEERGDFFTKIVNEL